MRNTEVDVPLGRVKWFNEIKGTGVIRGLEGGDFTVHFGEILDDGFRTLFEGEMVEFDAMPEGRGPEAAKVRRLSEGISRRIEVASEAQECGPETVDRNLETWSQEHAMRRLDPEGDSHV